MQPTEFGFIFWFLPTTTVIYWGVAKRISLRAARWALLASSGIFILAFSLTSLLVFTALILITWSIGNQLSEFAETSHLSLGMRRTLFALGMVVNGGALFYYKYFATLSSSLPSVFGRANQIEEQTLPLGISFFTFVQMIHLHNCYRGLEIKPRIRLTEYAQVLTFYPHLVAGPIVTVNELVPQLRSTERGTIKPERVALGLFLISLGLFKKLAVADGLIDNVRVVFDDGVNDGLRTWIGVGSYTFQLYFDFSGYVDIARGASMLFALTLGHNFDSPLKASNISEFWARWHMTLTHLANKYVFTPIALSLRRRRKGSEVSKTSEWLNGLALPTLATFLILGIWHGAGMNFVVFGVWHGLGVVLHRSWSKLGLKTSKPIGTLLTFLFVTLGFVFFRSSSLGTATQIIDTMFGMRTVFGDSYRILLINLDGDAAELGRLGMVLVAGIIAFFTPSSKNLEARFKTDVRHLLWLTTALAFSLPFMSRQSPFLYWQF